MTITHQNIYGSFSNTINREFFSMMMGGVLGAGEFRIVYEHMHRDDLVLKWEPNSQSFQNIAEWEFWQDYKDEKTVARWLAPCEFISPCGVILAQKKTTEPERSHYPKTMPEFLCDLKRRNFGLLNGKLVAHDYGMHIVKVPTKRKKVTWWDHPTPKT